MLQSGQAELQSSGRVALGVAYRRVSRIRMPVASGIQTAKPKPFGLESHLGGHSRWHAQAV